MLRVFFDETGEIMEYAYGGLTRKRFKMITMNLIDGVESIRAGKTVDGSCRFGDYSMYCRIAASGKGVLQTYHNNNLIHTRLLNDVYWYGKDKSMA